jgi:serine phosphatase RsbU (regulator of sigma subunit)
VAGVPLGSFPGSAYDEVTLSLEPGDVFLFCSDGITEARDEPGREFGTARLLQVAERGSRGSAREIVDGVFASVMEFRGEAAVHDDMTAVAVKIPG